MIWKIRFGRWRATFSLAPVTDIIGVNSKLPNGQHILMWDFDNIPLDQVKRELDFAQATHSLSKIYILQSSPGDHYIAYCFTAVDFTEALHIISGTKGVDRSFIKYGDYRERFTLRVSPKNKHRPKLVAVLPSDLPEEAGISDLRSWTQYETTDWADPPPGACPGCDNILRHCRTLDIKAKGRDTEK